MSPCARACACARARGAWGRGGAVRSGRQSAAVSSRGDSRPVWLMPPPSIRPAPPPSPCRAQLAKYTLDAVPYPFTSREQYERATRHPLGKVSAPRAPLLRSPTLCLLGGPGRAESHGAPHRAALIHSRTSDRLRSLRSCCARALPVAGVEHDQVARAPHPEAGQRRGGRTDRANGAASQGALVSSAPSAAHHMTFILNDYMKVYIRRVM